MYRRIVLLWLLIGLILLGAPAEAALMASAAPETALDGQSIPRPRYKYYRHKAKARKAKRKARKQKAKRGLFRRKPKGVITIDAPVRNN